MESLTYILWSARLGAWFTAGGTYISDLNQAKQFTYTEALDQCKVFRGSQGAAFALLPVPVQLLAEIAK